jgi:choline dehydrogenase
VADHADTVVIGGGTAGAVVAGVLAANSDERVVVLEAGPDFGSFESGRWPEDLLDARALGYSHDWRYDSEERYPGRIVTFERAKVIGGCSSHNGCAAIWGSRVDYDRWAALGLDGWATDDLLPLFASATERMRVRVPASEEITPFQEAVLQAASAAGIPRVENLNDVDADEGMAPSPVNIWQGTRWNSAFAYLDPVRDRANLRIEGNCVVDRLLIEGDRVSGVRYLGPDGPQTIAAGRVVVAGGTYGSPAILLRSGIGDPEELRALGIPPQIPLRGVGRNLHDHPAVSLDYAGTPEAVARMTAFRESVWMPEEQTIAKIRTPRYPGSERGFDLHLYPVGGPDSDMPSGWHWFLPVACMTPRSRGALTLRSADPLIAPRIDHGYLNDPDGHDRATLVEGVRIARDVASHVPLRELLGEEVGPGSGVRDDAAIAAWIDSAVGHYYHPVGTCRMGRDDDPLAVTDARGRIHGLQNASVADCSIVPVIPRANTNMPAIAIGERIARWLLEE